MANQNNLPDNCSGLAHDNPEEGSSIAKLIEVLKDPQRNKIGTLKEVTAICDSLNLCLPILLGNIKNTTCDAMKREESKDTEIQNLRNKLNDKNISNKNLRNASIAKTEENKKLEAELKTKNDEIQKLKNNLDAKNEEIEGIKITLKTKDEDIQKLKNNLDAKNEEIEGIKITLKTKDEKIQKLENESKTKDNEIQKLKDDLKTEKSQLDTATRDLSKAEKTIKALEDSVHKMMAAQDECFSSENDDESVSDNELETETGYGEFTEEKYDENEDDSVDDGDKNEKSKAKLEAPLLTLAHNLDRSDMSRRTFTVDNNESTTVKKTPTPTPTPKQPTTTPKQPPPKPTPLTSKQPTPKQSMPKQPGQTKPTISRHDPDMEKLVAVIENFYPDKYGYGGLPPQELKDLAYKLEKDGKIILID